MSYFAAVVARAPQGWAAAELELRDVADIEDVADRVREVSSDSPVALLFVEADDAYLAILRLDEGEDFRAFCSDGMFAEESRLGAILLGEIEDPALDFEAEAAVDGSQEALDGPAVPEAEIEPVGDPDLLRDLGVSTHKLLSLCGNEGMLPADVTAEICQLLGCGDEVEELREA